MAVSQQQVERMARLARVRLTQKEVKRFGVEFEKILEYFEVLSEVPDATPPMTHPIETKTVLREDEAVPQAPEVVEALREAAPGTEKGYLKVRQVL